MRKFIVSIALVATLAGASSAFAQDKATNAPIAATNGISIKRAQTGPFNGTVASVDATAKSLTLKGEKKQVLFITPETKILKDGKPAGFDAIAPGLRVAGFKALNKDGKWEAKSLKMMDARAIPAPKPTPAPATPKP